MVIFDSNEFYSENMAIVFDNTAITADYISISKNFEDFIEIDVVFKKVFSIEQIQREVENLPCEIKVCPDTKNWYTYFSLFANSFIEFNIDTKNYKFYCKNNCRFFKDHSVIENFNENYFEYSKKSTIDEYDESIINDVLESQNKLCWFNDQNIFVENEYNRIKKLVNKRNLTSSDTSFDVSVIKQSSGVHDPLKALDNCIGLKDVKNEILRLEAVLEYRRKNNIDKATESMHMCFYGNPGTGKTTIARIMAGILYNFGYIEENKCTEVNGLELKGATVGQTSIITKNIIDYAKGGVLFIDEAYTLFDRTKNNFGIEAVNILLKEMEDNRDNLIVILAGYLGPMQKLLDSNVGFRSRIKYYFDFKDYDEYELFEIFIKLLRNKHLYIEKDAMEKIILNFRYQRLKKGFGNGRYVENYLTKIEEEHILNVSKGISECDIISINDIIEEVDSFDM